MIRPQSKRVKELQASVAAVKKGDEVTTAGGIAGKVTTVEDLVVEVEIPTGVKVTTVKSPLAALAPRAPQPAHDYDARFSALAHHAARPPPPAPSPPPGPPPLPPRATPPA